MTPRLEQLEPRCLPSGVPVLNSNLGAPISLYLDFDSFSIAQWGNFRNVVIPAFSIDQRLDDVNPSEATWITKVFRYVAEDYSPFNVNVTTVEPTSFADGIAIRVAIGGNGAWLGGASGGISFVGSFVNPSLSNVAFVFPDNLGQDPADIGVAISHEAGHSFGLTHQTEWAPDGTFVSQYRSGPGDGTAPIMGAAYGERRTLWWFGPNLGPSTFQDDFAVLANVLGLRPDVDGRILVGGTAANGVVETMQDQDTFTFTPQTRDGTFLVRVTVPAPYNNLDSKLTIKQGDVVLASSSNPNGFGVPLTVKLTAGTTYTMTVAGAGPSSGSTPTNYGYNVGQYTVKVTRQPTPVPQALLDLLIWDWTQNDRAVGNYEAVVGSSWPTGPVFQQDEEP